MKDSVSILNAFRNKYYTDGNNTENGIVANAIDDILPEYVKFKREITHEMKHGKMTNGEKLIKEYPEFVAHYLSKGCDMFGECESCPLYETGDCGNEEKIEKWLKEEAEEDDRS